MNDEDMAGIAVIGWAGRFPGAASVDELWRNLLTGTRTIRQVTPAELRAAGVPDALAADQSYVPAAADIDDPDLFDAEFFGVPGHEARLMDPQHRLFLESCWLALEDAGHSPATFPGRIGVFGATGISTYLHHILTAGEEVPADGISYPLLLGNDKDFLCTRVAHRLGLTGPAVTVQTACSSSLVAVHLAMQSLLTGDCDIALAGGVSVPVPGRSGYLYREGGILSPDGHCRVFDESAAGTVPGSGCGVVVLRRVGDAVGDLDRINAILRGSAVNNDGADKMGFTAPGRAGQVEVIREAVTISGVPAADIGYVEAHGTGTALGDPIEIRALTYALSADGRPPAECRIGSVKANIGHLDAAAGVTGLIKAALVLREQQIPVQADFDRPNPGIQEFLGSYQIPTETIDCEGTLRAAGVSAFGLGGTNAHVVLTAPPSIAGRPPVPVTLEGYLVPLSATTPAGLAAAAGLLRDHLIANPGTRLDDVAYTLARGRTSFDVRTAVRASSVDELIDRLGDLAGGVELEPDEAVSAWVSGGALDPDAIGDCTYARRIQLPGHPLNRTRHWVDPITPVTPAPAVASAPLPGGDLETQVRSVLVRMLDVAELAPDDDFYDHGMDSMRAVEVVTALRDRTGLPITFDQFDGLRTLNQVVEHFRPSQTAPAPAAPAAPAQRHLLSKLRDGSTDGHVFFLPPAGGTSVSYIELSRHLTDPRTLWALGHPAGPEGTSIRDLARLYTELIRYTQPTGPYTLVGYSFGGSVAVEIAIELERLGERVDRIVMLDSHPPEAYLGGSADTAAFREAFPALIGEILPGTVIDAVPPTARTPEELIEALADASWSPAMKAEMTRFYGIWEDNHQALKRWLPDRRINADLVVLAAEEPENEKIMSLLAIQPVERKEWDRHTTGRLWVVPVGGDHYSMIRSAERVGETGWALDRALTSDDPTAAIAGARPARLVVGQPLQRMLLDTAAEIPVRPVVALVRVDNDDPMSPVNFRLHQRLFAEVGFEVRAHDLPRDTSWEELSELIGKFNADDEVDVVLVLIPLPEHLDIRAVLATIDPAKEAEGLHLDHVARLNPLSALPPERLPVVPMAVSVLLGAIPFDTENQQVVVLTDPALTETNPVAKMVARVAAFSALPPSASGTAVPITHPRAQQIAQSADLLIVSITSPEVVTGDWIKPGAVVLDFNPVFVGFRPSRKDPSREVPHLVGGVHLESVRAVADAVVPAPGGVGPVMLGALVQQIAGIAAGRAAARAAEEINRSAEVVG